MRDGGASFGNFLAAITALGFLRVGARLFQRSLQFFVIESKKDLAGLHGIAFANEHLVDAPADFGTDADVARLNVTGAH